MIISTKIKNVTEIGKYNFNLHVKLFSYFHSGMLHTGFDAVADTLELQCIQQTFPKMFGVLEGFGLPYNKIGATMVAWTQEQVLFFFISGRILICSDLYTTWSFFECASIGIT